MRGGFYISLQQFAFIKAWNIPYGVSCASLTQASWQPGLLVNNVGLTWGLRPGQWTRWPPGRSIYASWSRGWAWGCSHCGRGWRGCGPSPWRSSWGDTPRVLMAGRRVPLHFRVHFPQMGASPVVHWTAGFICWAFVLFKCQCLTTEEKSHCL